MGMKVDRCGAGGRKRERFGSRHRRWGTGAGAPETNCEEDLYRTADTWLVEGPD